MTAADTAPPEAAPSEAAPSDAALGEPASDEPAPCKSTPLLPPESGIVTLLRDDYDNNDNDNDNGEIGEVTIPEKVENPDRKNRYGRISEKRKTKISAGTLDINRLFDCHAFERDTV